MRLDVLIPILVDRINEDQSGWFKASADQPPATNLLEYNRRLRSSSAPQGLLEQLSARYRKTIFFALTTAFLSACQTPGSSVRHDSVSNGSMVTTENSSLPLAVKDIVQEIKAAVSAGEFPASLSEKIGALIPELNGGWTEVQTRILTEVFKAGKKIQTALQKGSTEEKQHADRLLSLLSWALNAFNFKAPSSNYGENNDLVRLLEMIKNTNVLNSASPRDTQTYSPPTQVEITQEPQKPAIVEPIPPAPVIPRLSETPLQPVPIQQPTPLPSKIATPPVAAPDSPDETPAQDKVGSQAKNAALLEHLRRLGLLPAKITVGSVVVSPSRTTVTAPRRFSPPARPADANSSISRPPVEQKGETKEQTRRNPIFDGLWNSMESNMTTRDLKHKIIAAHRVPHRWKQLLFLAQESGLDETLYYLNVDNEERNKSLLSVFLLNDINAYTKDYDTELALPVLRKFLLHLARYQLSKSSREYPSFGNIKASLGNLEAKIEQGVSANPDHFLVVDISQQLLYLVRRFSQGRYAIQATYPVSTAEKGVYQNTKRVVPEKTPLGAMRITGLWGGHSRLNQVYDGGWRNKRVKTEKVTDDEDVSREMIGGVMPVESLDPATPSAAIYIHGTNKELYLGKPDSAGCVSIAPEVAVRLLRILKKRTLVYIQR